MPLEKKMKIRSSAVIGLAWAAAMGVGLYFLSSMPKYEVPQAPADRDAKLWNRGRVMYQARCTSCHNSNPDLHGSVGPALRGVPEELLRDRLSHGKGGMPAFPNLVWLAPSLREYLR